MYFGELETDSPANVSGTTIHHATPSLDTGASYLSILERIAAGG
jgi:hypothetical protein